jgi:aryl-alcohol dehydrogenase-like predicted oxidoreductase
LENRAELPLGVGEFIVSFALPLDTTVIIGAKSMDQLRDNSDSTRVQPDVADGRQSTASMNQMAPRRSNECKG